MKKIYALAFTLLAAFGANAQTIPNAGMELWRTSSAGFPLPAVPIETPQQWYAADSTIITLGQLYDISTSSSHNWKRQTFKESAIKHGGSYSAKIMTRDQDTLLGIVPAILSNANATVVIGTSGGSPSIDGITYHGGTAVTEKPLTVSAWVNYQPGKDGTGATGIDSGRFTVQALSFIAGKDSIVGVGIATIPPTGGTWIQATATIVYTAYGTTPIDTMRITFTSSRGIGNLDSSTLYVDDLSMTSQPQSVAEVSGKQVANVYPNPANGSLYIDGTYSAEATITLIAANGQVVTTKTLTGKDVIDLTALPSGIYCYTIADKISGVLQNGKVNVTK